MSTWFIFLFTNNSPKLRLLLLGFEHRVGGRSAFSLTSWVICRFFSRLFKVKFEGGFLLNPRFWGISETESGLERDNHRLCW